MDDTGAATAETATVSDEELGRFWNSGWEACRREALAVAEREGDEAAVDWLIRHPAG